MLASTHMTATWKTILWAVVALGIALANVFSSGFRVAPKAIRRIGNKLKMEAATSSNLESTKEPFEAAVEQQKAVHGDSVETHAGGHDKDNQFGAEVKGAVEQQKAAYEDSLETQLKVPSHDEAAVEQQKAAYEDSSETQLKAPSHDEAAYGDSLETQLKVPSDDLGARSETLKQAPLQQSVQEDVGDPREDVEITVGDEVFKESSATLMLSSPVFAAMLQSDTFKEGRTKKFPLPGKSSEEYAIFRRFLRPRAINGERITMENVDVMIPWFDEYQMSEMLDECQALLLTQEVNAKRLDQAAKYGLTAQYERCLKEVAENFTLMNVYDIPKDVETMLTLLGAIQKAQEKAQERQARDLRNFKRKTKQEVDSAATKLFNTLRSSFEGQNGVLTDQGCKNMVTNINANLNI